ncbi:MAG: TPM domain-containing protein [Bacteroidota bacterium]
MRCVISFVTTVLLLAPIFVSAQFTIPKKPEKQTSVYDDIPLLTSAQSKALENKLLRYADSTSTQIAISIIKTTKGEEIKYLATRWAHDWGIGQAKEDNGIFILVAKDDRQVTIQTGYGVEASLTDLASKRIIERLIVPAFKQGDYYGGLDAGTDAIFQILTGQFKETRTFGDDAPSLRSLFPFIVFIVIMLILASRKNKGGRNNRGGRGGRGLDIWDMIILSNMGRGGYRGGGLGGGSGGFGSGGFGGGFGGGGFGGGGASGSW